ncbi:MAG: 30S ribosomal protein S6 [Planctomycetes bacterium]|nr:30S ribosomal protein S6 [Planctomycetota bacterium]
MANVTYEGMFLLDSNKYAVDPEGVKGEVSALLERVGATVLATRPWQDGKLSYEIKGHRKGLHYLVYFSMDSRSLTELERLSKFNESILRHMVIKLPEALIEPMLAMATGKGEVITTFHDSEAVNMDIPAAVETI